MRVPSSSVRHTGGRRRRASSGLAELGRGARRRWRRRRARGRGWPSRGCPPAWCPGGASKMRPSRRRACTRLARRAGHDGREFSRLSIGCMIRRPSAFAPSWLSARPWALRALPRPRQLAARRGSRPRAEPQAAQPQRAPVSRATPASCSRSAPRACRSARPGTARARGACGCRVGSCVHQLAVARADRRPGCRRGNTRSPLLHHRRQQRHAVDRAGLVLEADHVAVGDAAAHPPPHLLAPRDTTPCRRSASSPGSARRRARSPPACRCRPAPARRATCSRAMSRRRRRRWAPGAPAPPRCSTRRGRRWRRSASSCRPPSSRIARTA